MFLARRAAPAVSRRAVFASTTRSTFVTSSIRRKEETKETANEEEHEDHYPHIKPQLPAGASTGRNMDKQLQDIRSEADLLPEGAAVGTVPSDLEQATGLERLEILGKMQGIDVFDMRPLPADRLGTKSDPIWVKSFGEEQYVGCTGCPADTHWTIWITLKRDRPLGRCKECGSCYMMDYVGPPIDEHHHHHGYKEPKSWHDYVRPEYRYGKLTKS
ncbi:MAG: Cytochrome c oxidase subunit 4 [Chrysothrix sp. TS-e1954]|nr:MAG: Cytochrome c oxidase subunit 4 [Chrysothrix sp. TS-e1954]